MVIVVDSIKFWQNEIKKNETSKLNPTDELFAFINDQILCLKRSLSSVGINVDSWEGGDQYDVDHKIMEELEVVTRELIFQIKSLIFEIKRRWKQSPPLNMVVFYLISGWLNVASESLKSTGKREVN